MASPRSAGILCYRLRGGAPEVLLAHPGGPFWAKKDLGAWTIPKGEIAEGEDAMAAAMREFNEETGIHATGPLAPLPPIRQRGGKTVLAWAMQGDCDPAALRSNTFLMEWPPRSGRMAEFPEVDRIQWFTFAEAQARILPAQAPLLHELERILNAKE